MVGDYVVIRWVCFCGVSLFGLALNCQFRGPGPGFAELLLEGVLVRLFLVGLYFVAWFAGYLVVVGGFVGFLVFWFVWSMFFMSLGLNGGRAAWVYDCLVSFAFVCLILWLLSGLVFLFWCILW